mmetsp:Transcript_67235/g.146562  ORF Transcript_67235/g.146562 Transcript_67235/m.146562 type:complete len:123 (-) Transcript_67235:79-447(-)
MIGLFETCRDEHATSVKFGSLPELCSSVEEIETFAALHRMPARKNQDEEASAPHATSLKFGIEEVEDEVLLHRPDVGSHHLTSILRVPVPGPSPVRSADRRSVEELEGVRRKVDAVDLPYSM